MIVNNTSSPQQKLPQRHHHHHHHHHQPQQSLSQRREEKEKEKEKLTKINLLDLKLFSKESNIHQPNIDVSESLLPFDYCSIEFSPSLSSKCSQPQNLRSRKEEAKSEKTEIKIKLENEKDGEAEQLFYGNISIIEQHQQQQQQQLHETQNSSFIISSQRHVQLRRYPSFRFDRNTSRRLRVALLLITATLTGTFKYLLFPTLSSTSLSSSSSSSFSSSSPPSSSSSSSSTYHSNTNYRMIPMIAQVTIVLSLVYAVILQSTYGYICIFRRLSSARAQHRYADRCWLFRYRFVDYFRRHIAFHLFFAVISIQFFLPNFHSTICRLFFDDTIVPIRGAAAHRRPTLPSNMTKNNNIKDADNNNNNNNNNADNDHNNKHNNFENFIQFYSWLSARITAPSTYRVMLLLGIEIALDTAMIVTFAFVTVRSAEMLIDAYRVNRDFAPLTVSYRHRTINDAPQFDGSNANYGDDEDRSNRRKSKIEKRNKP